MAKCGRKPSDLLGKRFGQLLVVANSGESTKNRKPLWICLCDCGNIVRVRSDHLVMSRTKSCGCLVGKGLHNDGAIGSKIHGCKRGAALRNHKWLLTHEQARQLVTGECFYCGISPTESHGYLPFNGIDRIDSSKDYSADNCVSCCKACNYAKHLSSQDEFYNWVERIYQHLAAKSVFSPKQKEPNLPPRDG